MIKKFKNWLIKRLLPIWARAELEAEIERLKERNQKLQMLNAQLNAYIDGLETGVKNQRKIAIYTGEVKK